MQCQMPDCTRQAEPGGLLCWKCRDWVDNDWDEVRHEDEQPVAVETVDTIWGPMVVGGEG